jgi:DNA-binding Lrp family transcriptional regulator
MVRRGLKILRLQARKVWSIEVSDSYIGAPQGAQAQRSDDHVTPHYPITEDYAPFTPGEMEVMRSSLKQQGLLIPIVTWNGMIVDGRHREKLCHELRIVPRYVEINNKCLTEDDMRRYVAGLNEHRRSRTRPLTNEEKRAKAETAIKADPARSDVAIHEELGDVSQPTVHRVRKELEEEGVIPRITPSNRKSRTGKVGEGARKTATKPAVGKRAVVTKVDHPIAPSTPVDQALEDRVDSVLVHVALTELGEAIRKVAPEMVAAGVVNEVSEMLDEVGTIRHWLNRFAYLLHQALVWRATEARDWPLAENGYVAELDDGCFYFIESGDESDPDDPTGYNVGYCDPRQGTDDDLHYEKLGTNLATTLMAKTIAQRHAYKLNDPGVRDAATQ